jgi:glycosyltransferase involved in cell wall biosynthesis
MRVAVATVAVPFQRGGADLLHDGLRAAIVEAGHAVDVISMPFRFFPEAEVHRAMQVWETEDLTSINLLEPDLVLCTAFPAYYARHPRKRTWLMHQLRSAYDLANTAEADLSAALREEVRARDVFHLSKCEQRYTIARNVSRRLLQYCGVDSEPVYHPPVDAAGFYRAEAKPYIFAPSRIESLKRQDLLVDAMTHVTSPVAVLFAGSGGQQRRLGDRILALGLSDRVQILGHVSRAELLAFYAHSLAVFFGPKDEDYGYVTLEAMLSSKPVITCTDSGGPLEFVEDGTTGRIVSSEPKAIAEAIDELYANRSLARKLGHNGRERYDALGLSWDSVVEKLLAR